MTYNDQVLHDLTMLYLKNQDLSSAPPSEVLDEYRKAFAEISSHHNEKSNKNWIV